MNVPLWLALGLALCWSLPFGVWAVLLVTAHLRAGSTRPGGVGAFQWHFFVPARDEEPVIGSTLTYLRKTFPTAHVWVIDDASTDETAAIVESAMAADPRVHLLRRYLPEARTGKSDALNAGYRALGEWLDPLIDRAGVIVAIVDADGRPSPQLLAQASGPDLFGNPNIGGAQAEIRISNRDLQPPASPLDPLAAWWHRTFVLLQEFEFRAIFMAMQLQRRYTRSVSLGGNGQLNRLSALDTVSGKSRAPWRGSLLEDFELGVHLLLAGWQNGATREAWVEQEAPWSVRRYLTQRTRWTQGSMECMRYLPEVLRSARLATLAKVEITYFLARQWIAIGGTLAFAWAIAAWIAGGWSVRPALGVFMIGAIVGGTQVAVWALVYKLRCEPTMKWRRILAVAVVSLVFGTVATSVILWRAFARLLRGRSTWAKTRRNVERSEGPVAREV